MLLKSRASLTWFRACFLPGRPKDISTPGMWATVSLSRQIVASVPHSLQRYNCHVIYVMKSVLANCVCQPKQVFVRQIIFCICNFKYQRKCRIISSGTFKRNRTDSLGPDLNCGRRQQVQHITGCQITGCYACLQCSLMNGLQRLCSLNWHSHWVTTPPPLCIKRPIYVFSSIGRSFLSSGIEVYGHTTLKTPVLITLVKQRWALLVLGWVTAWENHVLLTLKVGRVAQSV